MGFEINTTYYLCDGEIKEILETILLGYSVEYAVDDFIHGIDDDDYRLALRIAEEKIVDYFKKSLDKC